MKFVKINNQEYKVNLNEFDIIKNEEYSTLEIISNLGYYERICSLIQELQISINMFPTCIFGKPTHGGYIPINCSKTFTNIYLPDDLNTHKSNIEYNISSHNVNNIILGEIPLDNDNQLDNFILFSENENSCLHIYYKYNLFENQSQFSIIITKFNHTFASKCKKFYKITNTNLYIYLSENVLETFIQHFHYYITTENNGSSDSSELGEPDKSIECINYDNLIHLCIIVKNGGKLFEDVLIKNIDLIDRWTILDTGSTDNITLPSIQNHLVGKKKGNLYQEPFINFRESRNRCFDLAGKTCKFNIMIDDTYIIQGDLRKFLNEIRGDQKADSYSLTVKSKDVEYLSNRITKSDRELRYIYTIHEIINPINNLNCRIPDDVYINDTDDEYMVQRSSSRNENDLINLFQMLKEYPNEPRHLYYLGNTYKMLKNHHKAAEYYYRRAFFHIDGFDQEKFDALFEYTRTSVYELKLPFNEYEKYFKLCIEWQPSRPEGDFHLGIHYYTENKLDIAFQHFKNAYTIGFPYHQQYSLKPTLSFYYVPYYLSSLCYIFQDYKLGLDCCSLFLQKNNSTVEFYQYIVDWYKIYELLNKKLENVDLSKFSFSSSSKPIFCVVADGGYTKWSGKDILINGVGGSETWVIEMTKYIKQLTDFEVIVFCNCEENEIFEGVHYNKLSEYISFISKNTIKYCMISRFSEYIPVSTINNNIENIFVILHDLQLSGNIIPIHPKIKKIFCLTEWHKNHFLQSFPQFSDRTFSLNYGIDFKNFTSSTIMKKPFSFIYSSFANRGLLVILKMWDKIIDKYPSATLNIFTDMSNKWVNTYYPEEIQEIRELLDKYSSSQSGSPSIKNHGWVNKQKLASYWKQSQVWFYPCTFKETFCLTALEAAITKTMVITNDLAGLQETVGNRGIVITGDSTTVEWQDNAFNKICDYLNNPIIGKNMIEQNYEWALQHSWKQMAETFLLNYVDKENLDKIPLEIFEKSIQKHSELNYLQMYNWTNDVPINSKQIFLQILDIFKGYSICNILEIGTFVGTSIIGMLQYLPNSVATTIDKWENYNENNIDILKNLESYNAQKIFYENITKTELIDRISVLKGDSASILMKLIKKGKLFDFIYVDGSHKYIDCYTDCLLSWNLLEKNGVLAMDDYLYIISKTDPFENPGVGIDYFLEKIKGQYTMLHKDYRIFIQKL